jgi:hypothetical protein
MHHVHMVNQQSHVRPEPFEARARRARAQNRMRKAGNHEPTASQMVFVGTRFSIGLLMQPGKRAGQLASVGTRFSIGLLMQPGKGAGQLATHSEPDNWPVAQLASVCGQLSCSLSRLH